MLRSQSAMEYLMTYGWAILIIAVVLGALFQLGVFNSANFAPRAQAGNCRVFRAAGMSNLQGVCTGVLPQYVARFDGASSYIQLPTSTEPTGAFTISFWLNPSSWTNVQHPAIFGGCSLCGGTAGGIDLTQSPDTQLHYEIYTSTAESWGSLAPPSIGSWEFVIMRWDGTAGSTAVTIYYNGVPSGSAAGLTGPLSWGGRKFYIGNAGSISSTLYFQGAIADFQIYNASLDANQISALYLKGIGAPPVDPAHVVGWWPLNGDANDYSGNNNNGAATAVTYASSWTGGYVTP